MRCRCSAGWCLCFVLAVASCVGCGGSDRTEVFGKVTLDGQPLADGDISFLPEPGVNAPQTSALITHGEYRLDSEWGLVPGTYQIRINGYRPPTDKSNMLAGGFLDKPPQTEGVPAREQFLPAKFNTESKLEKLQVPAGEASIERNYDLKE